jgi:hypothetical protein
LLTPVSLILAYALSDAKNHRSQRAIEHVIAIEHRESYLDTATVAADTCSGLSTSYEQLEALFCMILGLERPKIALGERALLGVKQI